MDDSRENDNILERLVVFANRSPLHSVEDRKAVNHVPEDGVFTVEVWRLCVGDEKLRAVGVGAAVSIREDPAAVVSERRRKLVLKLPAPDAVPAFPPPCRVAALDYELGYVPVEDCVIVVPSGAECKEVFAGLWYKVAVQLHFDVPEACLQRDAHRFLFLFLFFSTLIF